MEGGDHQGPSPSLPTDGDKSRRGIGDPCSDRRTYVQAAGIRLGS